MSARVAIRGSWLQNVRDSLPGLAWTSLPFSQDIEARGGRSPRIRDARSLARGGVLRQYVEHGKQAQRSSHGLIAPRSRRPVRKAG